MAKPKGIKDDILKLRAEGLSFRAIEKRLRCSKATVSYHINSIQKENTLNRQRKRRNKIKLGEPTKVDRRKKYKCLKCDKDVKYRLKYCSRECRKGIERPDKLEHDHLGNCSKLCKLCNKIKLVEEFYRRRTKTGISSYCKKCHQIQSIKRQYKFKQMCVEYKGGKCVKCGYSNSQSALDFHHRNASEKSFCISHAKKWTFDERVKDELDKCDLLCANCHRETEQKHFFD